MAESDRGWWYKQLRVDEWKAKFDFTNSGVNLSDPYDLCVGKCTIKLSCRARHPSYGAVVCFLLLLRRATCTAFLSLPGPCFEFALPDG